MENTGKKFMKATHFDNLDISDQMMGEEAPPLQWPPSPANRVIDLPVPDDAYAASISFREVMEHRRSHRRYLTSPIKLSELSWLLYACQGVQEIYPGSATLRTVPSAGARHALETFILTGNIESLPVGVARYCALDHKLEIIREDDDAPHEITTAFLGQEMVYTAAATFIWAVDIRRMTWRYGQRGYRYLHLEAGHICQNLYLAAEGIDCGVCAIAAYDDEQINTLLDFDGENQFVIYLASLGKT